MKKYLFLPVLFFLILFSDTSYSQQPISLKPLKYDYNNNLNLKSDKKLGVTPGAYGGFNLGLAIIEGQAGFDIGVFTEFRSREFAFVPQANYWTTNNQNNFELAGLARFNISKTGLLPYIDGGIGINFYNSDSQDFTKLSLIIGGGIELDKVSPSFTILVDGKYKLIVNDPGNISGFVFTAGMKFPFE